MRYYAQIMNELLRKNYFLKDEQLAHGYQGQGKAKSVRGTRKTLTGTWSTKKPNHYNKHPEEFHARDSNAINYLI